MTIAMRGLCSRLIIIVAAAAALVATPVAADAATVTREGNTLFILEDGTPNQPAVQKNLITVTGNAGTAATIVVSEGGDTNLQPVAPCISEGTNPQAPSRRVLCPVAGTTTAHIDVGENADVVSLSSETLRDVAPMLTSSTIFGGPGEDNLSGLIAGADTIRGQDDPDDIFGHGLNDILEGGQGGDTLDGGDGDDRLRGGLGGDIFYGGSGTSDTVDYHTTDSSSQVSPITNTQRVGAEINGAPTSGAGCQGTGSSCEQDTIFTDVENLEGTNQADILRGSSANNTLTGRQGADKLFGQDGTDSLVGGDGDDELQGGLHNDTLSGGNGDNDYVDYTDRTRLGNEDDRVTVDLDREDATNGGNLDGPPTAPAPAPAGSRDTITDVEHARTGAGDDTLIGADDTSEVNILIGGDGNDLMNGRDGQDTFIGGLGTDTVTYVDEDDDTTSSNVGVRVTPGVNSNDDGGDDDGSEGARDTVSGDVENLIGSGDNDQLFGTTAINHLQGLGGNDRFVGYSEADIFEGGAGTDTVSYEDRLEGQAVVASLDGDDNDGNADDGPAGARDHIMADVESLVGGAGNDLLIGNSPVVGGSNGNNSLNGAGGNDVLRGGLGSDNFTGGTGEDTVDYSNDTRAAGLNVTIGNGSADDGQATEGDAVNVDVENVIATAFADSVDGNEIANKLFGLGGADTLRAFGGNDTVDGGSDAGDTVDGGSGNDLLHGGSNGSTSDGADTIFGGGGDEDTVTYATSTDPAVKTASGDPLPGSSERTGAVIVQLDQTAVGNDGEAGENDQVTLVENVIGGQGNDDLTGTVGTAGVERNRLEGRAGNDTLDPGNEGTTPLADVLIGGDGARDHADYERRTDALTITLDGVANDGSQIEGAEERDNVDSTIEDVTTGSGADTVTGSSVPNVIATRAGNDNVDSRDATADTVNCGADNDTVTADRRDALTGCETQNLPPQPLVSVADATDAEGGDVVFTVTLDDTTAQVVTVDYATSPGSAGAEDFTPTSGKLTFQGGETTKTISVPTTQDSLDENAETFTLTLSNPQNAGLAPGGGADATGTITDNDAPPTVSVGTGSAPEGNDGTTTLSVPITLSAASGKDVTVTYSTSAGGSATPDADYTPVTDTVTIPAGETSVAAPVQIVGDTSDEPNETFDVKISEPTNATIGTATAAQTIEDDDLAPTVSIADASTEEGNSGTKNMTFTLTLSAASSQTVRVGYSTTSGSATGGTGDTGDFTQTTGTATFEPGQTQVTVNVPVRGDDAPEADETFTVTLANPENTTIADGSATGTIIDDDRPSLSVGNATVDESDTNAGFAVTLSRPSERPITVNYTTANGSAIQPGDFTETSGTLTFAPGEVAKTVNVPIKEDALDEDNETFTLELSGAEGATTEDGTGVGTIDDDDESPSLAVAGGEITEGNEGTQALTFTVTQSAVSGRDVLVKYATADGTAKAGEDYTATSGTLTIKAGATTGEVKVPVTGDTAAEEAEAFTLTLSEPTNATLAEDKGTATGTINNDDAAVVTPPVVPALSVNDIKVAEGDTGTAPAVFTVSLSVPTTRDVTVKYVTSDGTATSGKDYALAAGTLTFAAGERSKTVSVNVMGDRTDEPDETFALALVEPQGATLAKGTGTATIADDETPRVAPNRVTARTTPSRDRSLPYRFRTSGRVVLPSGVRRADGCAGKVQVRFKAGKKTISTRRVNLRKDCTFTRRVSFGIKSRLKPGRLKVEVRFLGNAVLLPKSAPRRFVRVVK